PLLRLCYYFFFLHDPPPPALATLSLPAALPISAGGRALPVVGLAIQARRVVQAMHEPARPGRRQRPGPHGDATGHGLGRGQQGLDRKSTRLNSSHVKTSYAVFCLKKKKNTTKAA